MRIGFFDSGIGGITVLHQALKLLPNENYIFYADTLHVPYGEKSREEVKQYIFDAVEFLAGQGVKALVVACNTATSVAVKELRETYSFPIIGMEPAVKPAVERRTSSQKRVLVLATELTLKETKFQNLVASVDHDAVVDRLPMPGLVKFAENGLFSEETVLPYLESKLSPFQLNQYETIVLGCTHFPYFKDALRKILPAHINIIDGSRGTVKYLKKILEQKNQLDDGTGVIQFFQSGFEVTDKATLDRYTDLFERLRELDETN